jgi:hypothetical protein
VSEALGLTFRDVDLERGAVSLDKNKTDEPRTWALGPDVAEALRRWREARSAEPAALLFPVASAESSDKLAEVLRAHLVTAKVERAELHHAGTNRRPLRVHDLRGTFVTLSLANGRTETWVADRTGHKSSQMINRYRRQARTASELGLGGLAPMGDAIENDPSTIHQTGSDAMVVKSSSNETSGIPAVSPPGLEPGRPFGQRIRLPTGKRGQGTVTKTSSKATAAFSSVTRAIPPDARAVPASADTTRIPSKYAVSVEP